MRADPVPSFTPASSPELQSFLDRFRDKVFIPEYLDRQYRRIIFKPNAKTVLAENPIYVSIGPSSQAKYQLQPVRPGDIPSKRRLKDVVGLMKTNEDWANLLPLLSGLAASHRKLDQDQWEWLVRKAGENGMQDAILTCAKHAKKTHLPLYKRKVAQNYFFNFHRQAQDAGFTGEGLQKAYDAAKASVILMHTRMHESPVPTEEVHPSKTPEIIGIILELRAARALDVAGGHDDNGKVQTHAKLVLSNWGLGDFSSIPKLWAANEKLQSLIPLWKGLELTLQVDEIRADKATSDALSARKTELEGYIDSNLEVIDSNESSPRNRTGIKLAQHLYKK